MASPLNPDFTKMLAFLKAQRDNPPETYAIHRGLLDTPEFFSLQRLQEHLNNPLLNADWVQLRSRGKVVPLDQITVWKNVQHKRLAFIDKGPIDELIDKGASIVMEGLDILDPEINRFLAEVDQSFPFVLANAVSFFSQRGHEAYKGHVDSDDVLVVQLSGQKHWKLFQPQQRRFLNTQDLGAAQLGPLLEELTLEPGDVLYVRTGVPHICRTEGTHSLHMAFDLIDRTPNIEQISAEANTQYNLACEDAYSEADQVVDRYRQLLNDDAFRKNLAEASESLRQEALSFRQQIGRASGISALDKFAN